MKKRILSLLALTLVFCLALAGCGKVEKEASTLLKEGEDAVASFVAEIQSDVKKVEDGVQMEGKAALEILKEDEQTLKYRFTVAEEAVTTEVKDLEEKAAGLGEQIQEHLTALETKGVADAQAVVQFVDKEGKELYSKIFK